MKLQLTLNEFLNHEKITVYRLAKQMIEMGWTRETVYGIARGRQRPSMESLEAVITSLETILGRDVSVTELLLEVRNNNSGL